MKGHAPSTSNASSGMYGSMGFTRAMIRAPMARVAAPFLCGLLAGQYASLPLAMCWGGLLAGFGAWWWLSARKQQYRRRWLPGMAFWGFFIWLGFSWQAMHNPAAHQDHISRLGPQAKGWQVVVSEVASNKERSVRAWAEVRAAVVDGLVRPARGSVLLTLLKDSTTAGPQPGDRLVLTSPIDTIDKQPDPGGFDVRAWAASRGVYHEVFAPREQWRSMQRSAGRWDPFGRMRDQINAWLGNSGLPDRERALTKALLLGQRDDMDRDQNQAFVRSGTIHVLAVSGTHVGIIYVAVLWALRFLGKSRKGRAARGLVALLALWTYAGLTGFTPSVMRATVMFTLFTVAEMVRWRTNSLNSLACAAVALLLWDPQLLGQLGFQLSFLAVLGIVVLYSPIQRLWAAPNAVVGFFWSLIAVSVAAQAFTAPLCLYTFHAFPVWFLPANLAIVGLVGIGVYGGAVLLLVHAIPVLGPLVAVLMKWLLLLLGFLAGYFAELPGAYPALRVGFWGMVGLYLLLALLCLWLLNRRSWARIASLATLAALLFGWAWTARQHNRQRSMVVYQDREGTACAFVQGRTMHVFSPVRSPWLERSIEQHLRGSGVYRTIRADSLPWTVEQGGLMYRFRRVDQELDVDPTVASSVTVMYGKGWMVGDLLDTLPAAQWVLGPDLESGARARLRRWAAEHGHEVFDVRSDGAYVRTP